MSSEGYGIIFDEMLKIIECRKLAMRLDMKSKIEFYGRLRDMIREHREKRWERLNWILEMTTPTTK